MSRATTTRSTRTLTLADRIASTGYSQPAAAAACGLSPNTVYSWCRGERRPWRASALRLARWLRCPVAEVYRAWQAGRGE